ncbi:MAG: HNH endonuclease [Parafilimonas sp.]
MVKKFPGELWTNVRFDFEFTNDYQLEVSNFGRLRSFNKISDGDLVQGSMINGYRIIRLKFFIQRDEKVQARLNNLQKQVTKLTAKLKAQIENGDSKKDIQETRLLLLTLKRNLQKKFKDDTQSRTINYHSLIHRLVADYFLPKPKASQTVVAHLDFNKLNNRVDNLKWMTPEENYAHQQKSPYVIKEKQQRSLGFRSNTKVAKLTVTKVMLLKKLLNQNKPVRQLVKQFKITDMQVYRIKRGENWKNIPAAK